MAYRRWLRIPMGIELSVAPKLYNDLLVILNLQSCRSVVSPDVHMKSLRDDSSEALGSDLAERYRRCVGKLLWLSASRPDICYLVKELSRKNSRPTQNAWAALRQLFRYLRGRTISEKILHTEKLYMLACPRHRFDPVKSTRVP